MNDRPAPHRHSATDDADRLIDDALRRQVRALQASAAEADALGGRVLAQWREQHGTAATMRGGAAGMAATLGLHAARRWRWAGLGTGLLACAVIATLMWTPPPDPVLDELLQADVLSQMAIGEL